MACCDDAVIVDKYLLPRFGGKHYRHSSSSDDNIKRKVVGKFKFGPGRLTSRQAMRDVLLIRQHDLTTWNKISFGTNQTLISAAAYFYGIYLFVILFVQFST